MSTRDNVSEEVLRLLPKEWRRLIGAAQRIGFGEVRIVLQNSKPIRIEMAVRQVKLDGPDEELDQGLKPLLL